MKRRSILTALLLAASLSLAAVSGGGRPTTAAEAIFSVDCSTRGPTAIFRRAIDPAIVSWSVDMSVADYGWLPGTYMTTGAIPVQAGSYRWDQLSLDRYYFRINQQTSDGYWWAGTTYMVMIQSCAPPIASAPFPMYPNGFYFDSFAPGTMTLPSYGMPGPMPGPYMPPMTPAR